MKKLFMFLLVILPFITLSQEKGESIYRKSANSWNIDNTTVQANYYAIIERDSLISENKKLRQRIKDVEAEKKELVQISLAALDNASNQLQLNQQATESLNSTNDEIINVWQRLYKGIHLNALAQTNFNEQVNFSLLLSAPIDLNWQIIASVSTSIKGKPFYLYGVSYNIF